jgi:hypothetical protein
MTHTIKIQVHGGEGFLQSAVFSQEIQRVTSVLPVS